MASDWASRTFWSFHFSDSMPNMASSSRNPGLVNNTRIVTFCQLPQAISKYRRVSNKNCL